MSIPLLASLIQQFTLRYGRSPVWIGSAPGRVNLIGEHTDYNGGFVLPMAIDRLTMVAADRATGAQTRIQSTATARPVQCPPDGGAPGGEPRWGGYVRGVLAEFARRGVQPGPVDLLVHSDVPWGGGLSSSAALEVAMATTLEAITGHKLSSREKVLLCQRAEHEYAFVPCGVMDQFTAVAAREDHVVLLDCRSLEPRLIPWADPSVVVLIVNSNVKHDLGKTNEYALRRQQCQEGARILGVELLRDITVAEVDASTDRLGPVLARRVGHVVRENARTLSAAETIARGNWRQLGQLLYESHVSLRDDFEVSCPELDVLVELAQAAGEANGIYGGRMTGGGFGGSTVNLVRADAVESLTGYFETEYRARVGIAPTVFATRPTGGARVVQAP